MNAPVPRPDGFREVRLWLPDLDAPGFRERLSADMARINAAEDASAWMEAAWFDLEASIRLAEDKPSA